MNIPPKISRNSLTQAPTLPLPSLPLASQASTLPIPSLPLPSQAPTLPIPSQAPTLPLPSLPLSQESTLSLPLPLSQEPTLPIPSLPIPTPKFKTPLPKPPLPSPVKTPIKAPPIPPSPLKLPLKVPSPMKIPLVSPPLIINPSSISTPVISSASIPASSIPISTPSLTAFDLIADTPPEYQKVSLPLPQQIKTSPPLPPPPQIKTPLPLPPPPQIKTPLPLPLPPQIKTPLPPSLKSSSDDLFSPMSSPISSPRGIYPLQSASINPLSSLNEMLGDIRETTMEKIRRKEREEKEEKIKKEKERVAKLREEENKAYRAAILERQMEEQKLKERFEKQRKDFLISKQMYYKDLNSVPSIYFLDKNKKDDSYLSESEKEALKSLEHVAWRMVFPSDTIMYVEERKEKSLEHKYDPYIPYYEAPLEFKKTFEEGRLREWVTLRLLFDKDKYVDVSWYSSKGITPEKMIDLASEFYNTPLTGYENVKSIYNDERVKYEHKYPKDMLSQVEAGTEFLGFIPLPNRIFLIKFDKL